MNVSIDGCWPFLCVDHIAAVHRVRRVGWDDMPLLSLGVKYTRLVLAAEAWLPPHVIIPMYMPCLSSQARVFLITTLTWSIHIYKCYRPTSSTDKQACWHWSCLSSYALSFLFSSRAKFHRLKYGTELNQGDMKPPSYDSGKTAHYLKSQAHGQYITTYSIWRHLCERMNLT